MIDYGNHFNPWRQFHGLFVPEWLAESPDLSAGAKLCYGRLCRYAGRDGVAYPDQVELAASLAVSPRQVRRYISDLVEAGLIVVEQRGLGMPNRYYFIWHPMIDGGGPDSGPGPGPGPGPAPSPAPTPRSPKRKAMAATREWTSKVTEPERTSVPASKRSPVSAPSVLLESVERVSKRGLRAAQTPEEDEGSVPGALPGGATDKPKPRTKLKRTRAVPAREVDQAEIHPPETFHGGALATYFARRADRALGSDPRAETSKGALGNTFAEWRDVRGYDLATVIRTIDLFFASEQFWRPGIPLWTSFLTHRAALLQKVTSASGFYADPELHRRTAAAGLAELRQLGEAARVRLAAGDR